ncbi:MAG TPA: FxLYD domain-containing protein [Candidatus Acidoferrum sp.]|nr:FxLYD domain-containing protein [Candidatus Acidoferrum sp.]
MRRALRGAVICAVLPMLTQACAGGMMENAPSASSAPRAPGAQSYGIYGTDSYFKLEWQPDERRGKPLVNGYVTNQWGISVNRVRLRVEALDAAGNVVATYIGYVVGDVTPGSHVYFEVFVQQKAPNYRVSVLSFNPIDGHG